ncbi:hypothetical protein KR032_009234, partial [Drosophila birchii]
LGHTFSIIVTKKITFIPQKPHIFEIEDGATMYDLKVQLETLVGVPVDRQEIHSLAKTLENEDRLTTLLRSQDFGDSIENVNGSAISLFHAQNFVCFLQFYSPSEVDAQRQFFLQPEDARKLPIDRLPQFCELSDSADSTSSSVSVRSNTSFESASTGSSSPEHKRRRVADVDEGTTKRQRASISTNYSTSTFTLTSKEGKTEALNQEGRINTISGSKILTSVKNSTKSDTETEDSSDDDDVRTITKPLQRQVREEIGCDKPVSRPPYPSTMPENIQYALVISNEDRKAESVDIKAVLKHFFSLFEKCAGNHLEFSERTTMTKLSSNLLVGCEDSKTADWVTSAVAGVCPPHSCLPFPKFYGLVRCSFVLPFLVPNKPMPSIFELLEKQNCGLVTDRWSMVGRSVLDPGSVNFEQKAVSSLCENEEIDLYIDGESRTLILGRCSKLKYCFWRLHFEFD